MYDGPVIDAHHHLWDLAMGRHPWLAATAGELGGLGDLGPIRRNYLPADFLADAAGRTVVASRACRGRLAGGRRPRRDALARRPRQGRRRRQPLCRARGAGRCRRGGADRGAGGQSAGRGDTRHPQLDAGSGPALRAARRPDGRSGLARRPRPTAAPRPRLRPHAVPAAARRGGTARRRPPPTSSSCWSTAAARSTAIPRVWRSGGAASPSWRGGRTW